MVKTEDKDGELIFSISGHKPTVGDTIRITREAQERLTEVCTETGLSARRVASEFILFAAEHYSVKRD